MVLIILDGWGLSPSWAGNAIVMNNSLNFSILWRSFPHKVLQAYAQETQKNIPIIDSRYAHASIGAGRYVAQDREIIDQQIADRSFYRNRVLVETINYVKKKGTNLHLIGLVSDGGIHSHVNHLIALLELCHRQNFSRVYLDVISDGVNSAPLSVSGFIQLVQRKMTETGVGQFSSIVGRKIAMPASGNEHDIQREYQMLVASKADHTETIEDAIKRAYHRGLDDASISPTLISTNEGIVSLKGGDGIIFFNFRADPIRKLVRRLIDPVFEAQKSEVLSNLLLTTLTRYFSKLNTQVAFPRESLSGNLPEALAKYQKTDLRITEKIKEPQVTTFFNGFRAEPYAGEEHWIVPSLKSNNLAKTPAMSGSKIVQLATGAIRGGKYDFILINFPNADVIAHTGNIVATGAAVRAVDGFTKSVVDATIAAGGVACVAADHGLAEEIRPKKGHSLNPVPFILISGERKRDLISGALSIPSSALAKMIGAKESIIDIAPTILELMNIPKPEGMIGHSLLNKLD